MANKHLRNTSNYIWSTERENFLGRGATAFVFKGFDKRNGRCVAVKSFLKQYIAHKSSDAPKKEFEMLKKVNHENVVKLLDIETDLRSEDDVIVMELCTGGSLLNVLTDPENVCGLDEGEFVLVLKHLCAGMRHLRDLNLIHRDLKPGNIMKFICDDGSTLYKLTDFGAARELVDENESFESIYGTEEYLHPDMFIRAVYPQDRNKHCNGTIDLWSIGATLYHAATGKLPFRPHGGRRNRRTMYKMITGKEPGVISGVQYESGGSIEYSKDLPEDCRLSDGLKEILTPLLADLLEKKHLSFDKFFKRSETIFTKIPVQIFYMNQSKFITAYVEPEESFLKQLRNFVKKHAGIDEANQLILYKSNVLNDNKNCPKTTTIDDPIFLFDMNNFDKFKVEIRLDLPEFIEFKSALSQFDYKLAVTKVCSDAHQCKRFIENYSLCCKHTPNGVECFIKNLQNNLEKLRNDVRHVCDKTDILKKTGHVIREFDIKTLNDNIVSIHQENCIENNLEALWKDVTKDTKCPYENLVQSKAETYIRQMRDAWSNTNRILTAENEHLQLLDMSKVREGYSTLRALLHSETLPQYEKIVDSFQNWWKFAFEIYKKTRNFEEELAKFDVGLKKFNIDNGDIKINKELRRKLKKHCNSDEYLRNNQTIGTCLNESMLKMERVLLKMKEQVRRHSELQHPKFSG